MRISRSIILFSNTAIIIMQAFERIVYIADDDDAVDEVVVAVYGQEAHTVSVN